MRPGSSLWELPLGVRREVGPQAVVGRGPTAELRIDDPRVSTVHAELSWRPEGLVLLARGGRVRVDGGGVRQVRVTPGLRVELAPGVEIVAVEVAAGVDSVVPDTAGRHARRYAVGEGSVVVFDAGRPPEGQVLGGVGGHLLARLLRAGATGEAWDVIAMQVWSEDGRIRGVPGSGWTSSDERRLRNRFDQHVRLLRQQLDGLERPPRVEVTGGIARILLGDDELIEVQAVGPP